ncbi:MAG: class III poly(R)-hydroxyalkanoic acid synthase subunit PhaE [Gammaproteobacteria bacterium]
MKEHNLFPFWNEDWVKLQKQYWDVWTAVQGDVGDKPNPKNNNPWAEVLDQWSKFLHPNGNEDTAALFERTVTQGKAFFQLSDEYTKFLKSASELTKASDDWQTLLRDRFEEVKSAFSSFQIPHGGPVGGLAAFWNLPLDTWRRTVSGASLLPGDFLQTVKPEVWEGVSEGLHERMERFLSVPGVGYTRESQEQVQETVRLTVNYQRAWQEYANAHACLGINTLERLSERVIQGIEKGEELKSLRNVYELWVECGEEVYLEFVSTDDYAEIYGRMVNALMALKHQGRAMADEGMGALGMPTRRGFDTIQRRQQELRRQLVELKANRERQDEVILRLDRDLAELRQVVARSANGRASQEIPATPAQAAVKKQTRIASRKKALPKKVQKSISNNDPSIGD